MLHIGIPFVVMLALGQTAPDTEAKLEAAFAKSIQYEKQLNYDEARKSLQVLGAAQQENYFVQVRLGWLAYRNGKYPEAQVSYEAAVRLSPKSTEAKLGLVLTVLAQGRWAEAEGLAKQVLQTDPQNYFANLRLAYALRMQSKFAQAEEIGEQLMEAYPADVSVLLELGLTKVGQNEKEAAAKMFQRVLLVDPENVIANQQLGRGSVKKKAG